MVGSLLKEHVFLSSFSAYGHIHIHFPSLSDCHFNTLLSWDSLGFREQEPYSVPDGIITDMVKNNLKYSFKDVRFVAFVVLICL